VALLLLLLARARDRTSAAAFGRDDSAPTLGIVDRTAPLILARDVSGDS
jgi:hypothetical protein